MTVASPDQVAATALISSSASVATGSPRRAFRRPAPPGGAAYGVCHALSCHVILCRGLCHAMEGRSCPPGSDGADAGSLRSLRTLGHLELHQLVLFEAAEAVAGDLRVVHEDIRAISKGNEAEAFLRVEPLDGSL